MGFESYGHVRHQPCPVCHKGAAMMGDSRWAYRGLVCSNECGEAADKAIRAAHESKTYRRAVAAEQRAAARKYDIERAAIDAINPDKPQAAGPYAGFF